MPQLILLLLFIGTGLWLYRRFIADAQHLANRSREMEEERRTGADGTLIKDEVTGEYRLRRDDD